MKTLWAFDLDGTLISNFTDYGFPILDFGKLMLSVFDHKAPYYQDILNLEQEIDKERFKTMRADRKRFPGSLVEVYHELCRRAGFAINSAIEHQVLEIGASAISEETYQNRTLIPGVEDLLQFLQNQGDLLYCVTAGDLVVQWMKWRGYKLGRFFPTQREYRVVKWEKLPILRRLRELHPGIPAVMVGDSIGSDLVPAVKSGYLPIHVPHPSVWDNGELKNDLPEGARRFGRISQIIVEYPNLFKPTS